MLFIRTLYQRKKKNVDSISGNSTLMGKLFWKKEDKQCFITLSLIYLSAGTKVVTKNFNQKRGNYLTLTAELKHLYDKFTFEIIRKVRLVW